VVYDGMFHPGNQGGNLSYECLTWPDTRNWEVELGGLEPPTPCLQTEPAPPADIAEL
jgi:hypothetical protein